MKLKNFLNSEKKLDQAIKEKSNKLADILTEVEISQYTAAVDKLGYICFESKFDRGNISNSAGKFVINDLFRQELFNYFKYDNIHPVSPETINYLVDIRPSQILCSINYYREAKEAGLKKLEDFISTYLDQLTANHNEHNKGLPKNSILIKTGISDISSGIECLVLNSEGLHHYNLRYQNFTKMEKFSSLKEAYDFLISMVENDDDELAF